MPQPLSNDLLGRTVTLDNVPGYDDRGNTITLNGSYYVEDYYGIDPSSHIHSPFFVIFREDHGCGGCHECESGSGIDPEALMEALGLIKVCPTCGGDGGADEGLCHQCYGYGYVSI